MNEGEINMTSKTINDLTSLKANAKDLDSELTAVFAKYGLEYAGRSASIGGGELKFNIKLKYGTAEDRTELEEKKYKSFAHLFGLPADAFGKVVTLSGDKFKIAGIDTNKPKNCVKLVRVRDQKPFKCPASSVINSKLEG